MNGGASSMRQNSDVGLRTSQEPQQIAPKKPSLPGVLAPPQTTSSQSNGGTEDKKPDWLEELSRKQAVRKSGLFKPDPPEPESKPQVPLKPSQARKSGTFSTSTTTTNATSAPVTKRLGSFEAKPMTDNNSTESTLSDANNQRFGGVTKPEPTIVKEPEIAKYKPTVVSKPQEPEIVVSSAPIENVKLTNDQLVEKTKKGEENEEDLEALSLLERVNNQIIYTFVH